jgi:hypothetical protein
MVVAVAVAYTQPVLEQVTAGQVAAVQVAT